MATSDSEENYWPGYVDALTTMTMVLTFIMLVLGLAVFSLSQNVSKGMLETIANALKLSDDMPKDMSPDDITRLVVERIGKQDEEIKTAKAEAAKLAAARVEEAGAPLIAPPHAGASPEVGEAGASPVDRRIESAAVAPTAPPNQATIVSLQQAQLRLVYKPRATGLDEAAREAISQALGPDSALQRAKTVEIIAGVDRGNLAVSDANRVAYYRALILRGQLLTAGIAPERIKVRIDPALAADQILISPTQ
jgi:hypothetical protein